MYSDNQVIAKKIPIAIFSGIILSLAIAGLIMDSNGVPWFSQGEYDFETATYGNFTSQDYSECCEESYESLIDEDIDRNETALLVFSPLTIYFVLILIFSACCMIVTIIDFDKRFKVPIVTLFGLATTTSGIFLARKSSITIAFYLQGLSSSGNSGPSIHAHVMVYFGLFLSLLCILLLGSMVIHSLKSELRISSMDSEKLVKTAQLFLSLSLIMFLLSPALPISYVSADKDYVGYDEDSGVEGEYVFAASLLIISDSLDYMEDELDDDDDDEREELAVMESTAGNYGVIDTLFFAMIWINLSVIMLLSLSLIPVVGKAFEAISQLNVLSIVILIIILIYSILLYVNLPDLLSEYGVFSETIYDQFYFHVNWLPLLCCIIGIINWIVFLKSSHLPFWKEFNQPNSNSPFSNFNQAEAAISQSGATQPSFSGFQQQPPQQAINQQPDYFQQQYGKQPPQY